ADTAVAQLFFPGPRRSRRGLFVARPMTLAFTPPPCPESTLRRLDPRWKLAALTLAALAAAVLRTQPAALLALGLAALLAALARLPPRWLLGRLGAVALFLALFALTLPFLLDGPEPGWQWGVVHFSPRGAAAALLICVKALAIVTLALVVLAT